MLLALLIGFVLAGWGSWLWRKVEPTLRDSDQYRLEPAQIEIRPDPPEWIRRDVRAEVLRGVAFGQPLSMLDENLPARIAEAFEFHPWVERATVVLRYPARAEVELVYRRPVARLMVENHAGEDQFVLDSTGVRLPETDLTAKEVASLPGIMGMSGIHLPVVGQRMEDERTREAVEVAAVLLDDWSSLRLVGIVPLAALQGETGERRQVFEL